MLLYTITQSSLFPGGEKARENALLNLTRKLARGGVHYLQIREKGLPLSELQTLTAAIVAAVQAEHSPMKILLNGPPEIAFETGCHGIHLSSRAPSGAALDARRLYRQAGSDCLVSAACHSVREIQERSAYADLLLFSPVFEKIMPSHRVPGIGLSALSEATAHAGPVPVLALGGVTANNAHACVAAGAKGIAAIRLFLDDGWTALA
jgi:thiamine-phosphate pyrophosphorylase